MATARPHLMAMTIHRESCGASLAPDHMSDTIGQSSPIDFFEVHAESYMSKGGPRHRLLEQTTAGYPVTLHSTGLSIASHHAPDREHLIGLRRLIDRYRPRPISVPLAWSIHDGAFLSADLPIPYNAEALACVCRNVDEAQQELGTQVLLRNSASYLSIEPSVLSEGAFLRAVVEQTGCSLVLDLANIYVSAINRGCEPMDLVDSFPIEEAQQIHLTGVSEETDDDCGRLLVCNPAVAIPETIWAIYRRTLGRTGPLPTVIEQHGIRASLARLAAETAMAKQALRRATRQSTNYHQLQTETSP
jgi:uncharacterized protein (UPF0276 family)